jgi:ankyrin repeat protein
MENKKIFSCLFTLFFLNILFINFTYAVNFNYLEMRLMTKEELLSSGFYQESILYALEDYHLSAAYTLGLDEYRFHPDSYTQNRIQKLETLSTLLKKIEASSVASKLFDQTQKKIQYLSALPPASDSRCNLSGTFETELMSKLISVKDTYCYETLDPLHRSNWGQGIYFDRWKISAIPNYFIYLETIEYHPLLNLYAPMQHSIKYFDEQERINHKLTFNEGLAFLNGALFDTTKLYSLHSGLGTCIYVLGPDNEFYVNNHEMGRIHHSSEFSGGPLEGAGEITAQEGQILKISSASGHYQPGLKEFLYTLNVLKEKTGTLKGIDAEAFVYDENGFCRMIATFDASDYLINSGVAVAKGGRLDWTPLHVAVCSGYTGLAPYVLTHQNVDERGFGNLTSLHLAAEQGSLEWINLLLEFGANLLAVDFEGNSSLHFAAKLGQYEAIPLLWSDAASELKNTDGATPLLCAFQGGDVKTVESLLKKGADLFQEDNLGNNPFHYCLCNKNPDLLSFLLKSNIKHKIDVANHLGKSPFFVAAESRDSKTLQLLQNIGINFKDVDAQGNTALHYAAAAGNTETTLYLIEQGGIDYLLQKNILGETAFHRGILSLPFSAIKIFIEKGAKIDIEDSSGNTPLFHALSDYGGINANINICGLLEMGANPHAINQQGQSAIHLAARSYDLSKLILLLTYSNDINMPDLSGNTTLHYSVMNGDLWMLSYLLDFVDPETIVRINNLGQTAFELANALENQEIKDFIQEWLKENE